MDTCDTRGQVGSGVCGAAGPGGPSPASGEALAGLGLVSGPGLAGEAGGLHRTEGGGRCLEQARRLEGWWARAAQPGGAPDLAGALTAADSGDAHVVLVPGEEWCAFGTGGARGGERGGLGCASCVETGAWGGLSLTLRRLGAPYGASRAIGDRSLSGLLDNAWRATKEDPDGLA